ncbi:ATP-binding cassette domain-containing protein [Allonocardiopsis opalescens]|uniref:UvrABC system protein A n=1 Tax=Allonocardiopsis opalescens TaxID=1144618 RepID=A0A2T0QDG1_9ACTN|nr:excinuclease ABC subunit UvrA [Allonocardiopsis opalescens]PRY01910.1 excinuclease ABC A subunit [Allonocardiopsis opalescens]
MDTKQQVTAEHDRIRVVGARENNLRDVSLEIPKGCLTVVTGVSGSGKSSLVFDTVAAESQRQLNETFPAFVRNRLPHYGQPEADALENLSATIVVDQRRLGGNARSTVGTATEIGPLLRLLYSRAGTPFVGYSPAFSFNDPRGMCPRCEGLGRVDDIDADRLLDYDRSLHEGAIRFSPFAPGGWRLRRYTETGLFDNDLPLRDYSAEQLHTLLHAEGFKPADPGPGWPPSSTYEGLLPRIRRGFLTRSNERAKPEVLAELDTFVTRRTCPACGGARLNAAALSSRVDGRTIAECTAMEAEALLEAVRGITDPKAATLVAALAARLEALISVGLGYLTLDRETPSLSGGESQRVKLVRHLGSSLTGMTYILDEPSAGLHPHDVARLNRLMLRLRDKGNTVLVVEHDRDVIAIADHVIDMGPGAGADGGTVVYQGDVAGLARSGTATGRHLAAAVRTRAEPRTPAGWIRVRGATRHNLRGVDADLPTGVLTAVTGVAGSGKSTLVREALPPSDPDTATIDQSPIPGSRRSSPATYTGVLDPIRRLFARANGVPAALFSANSAGGCPECGGLGVIETDLAFMDPVTTVCEACGGARFSPEALRHRLRGRDIAQVLGLSVADARDFFTEPEIAPALARLDEVGLGYLSLDQPLSTLSGGERQRIKLAAVLDRGGGRYVLDEPTTGLHPSDTGRLLAVLDRLVDQGGTVVVIEHDLEVIARADWVLDLGPGPGRHGGRVLFAGRPAALAESPDSLTGRHLCGFRYDTTSAERKRRKAHANSTTA